MTLLNKARQNRLIALQKLAERETNIFANLTPAAPSIRFATRRAA